jgi:hypothetical protein
LKSSAFDAEHRTNDRRRQRGRRDDGRGRLFNSIGLGRPTQVLRRLAAVAVLIAIVIVIVVGAIAVDHDVVVAMPVSIAAVNSDAANPDIDVFRDDHRVIAGVHRTGKCRHCQEWNKTKSKHSILGILHGTLFGWGRSTSRCLLRCALDTSEVCIGLTDTVPDALDASLKERGPAGAHRIKVRLSA